MTTTKDPRPKTTQQVRCIFGEARKRGLDNEQLHELVAGVVGAANSGRPSAPGEVRSPGLPIVTGDTGPCQALLHNDGAADASDGAIERVSIASLTYAQAEAVIERLKGRSFVPRRTLQYRRQKAGVKQLVHEHQLDLIAQLASQRQWSPETLVKFCKRQCGHHPPRTTEDANKIIEGLKAMNRREGLWAA